MNDENKDNKIIDDKNIEINEDVNLIPDNHIDNEDYLDEDGGNDQLIKKLRSRIKELEIKSQEYLLGWQKERADGVNLRKRLEEEKKEFVVFAKENMVMEVIPVLDSFELAFKNKESWEKVDKNWRQGVEYIYSQLKNVILNNGVSTISPLGEVFNPQRDEAVEEVYISDKSKDHTIVEVLSIGYKLGEKIIRAPKVKVAIIKN